MRPLVGQLKPNGSTWHVDETFVRLAVPLLYVVWAVDSDGQTMDFYLFETRDREAAKCFLKQGFGQPGEPCASCLRQG